MADNSLETWVGDQLHSILGACPCLRESSDGQPVSCVRPHCFVLWLTSFPAAVQSPDVHEPCRRSGADPSEVCSCTSEEGAVRRRARRPAAGQRLPRGRTHDSICDTAPGTRAPSQDRNRTFYLAVTYWLAARTVLHVAATAHVLAMYIGGDDTQCTISCTSTTRTRLSVREIRTASASVAVGYPAQTLSTPHV